MTKQLIWDDLNTAVDPSRVVGFKRKAASRYLILDTGALLPWIMGEQDTFELFGWHYEQDGDGDD